MTEFELDASQAAAAGIRPGDRQLVFAGPGAGKSEVVGALAAHLIDVDSPDRIYPEEILIISFSRAAVDVVRRRTAEVVDEGRGVDVATIDSLAARLLFEHCDDDHHNAGYEEAIKAARKLLTDSDSPLLDHVRHVIIDEMQDVVGVRAEFVLALLTRGVPDDAGFTLLADPLQSLYDFQLDKCSDITSGDLLEAIRMRWAPVERDLTGDYRSRSMDARRVSESRGSLLPLQPQQRMRHLRRLLAELPPLGDLDATAVSDIASWSGSTALLCDTNVRAVLVTDRLADHGCGARLAASALDPGIPAWVAGVASGRSTGFLTQEDFRRRADELGLSDPDNLWWQLIEIAPGGRGVDLDSLVRRLDDPREAARLDRQDQSAVIASTVHRSKGLEFENVVLVDPDEWLRDDSAPDHLASMLYVALSRGRQRVTIATGVPTRGWSRDKRSPGHPWVCRGHRGRGSSELIMDPSHARALGPVDDDLNDLVGRTPVWHRGADHLTVDDELIPSWVATVDGTPVARTGVELGRIVRRLRFNSWGTYPNLVGGRVESLETVIDPRAVEGRRIWTGARITGAVRLDWRE